jgi:hypothetical protein
MYYGCPGSLPFACSLDPFYGEPATENNVFSDKDIFVNTKQ